MSYVDVVVLCRLNNRPLTLRYLVLSRDRPTLMLGRRERVCLVFFFLYDSTDPQVLRLPLMTSPTSCHDQLLSLLLLSPLCLMKRVTYTLRRPLMHTHSLLSLSLCWRMKERGVRGLRLRTLQQLHTQSDQDRFHHWQLWYVGRTSRLNSQANSYSLHQFESSTTTPTLLSPSDYKQFLDEARDSSCHTLSLRFNRYDLLSVYTHSHSQNCQPMSFTLLIVV